MYLLLCLQPVAFDTPGPGQASVTRFLHSSAPLPSPLIPLLSSFLHPFSLSSSFPLPFSLSSSFPLPFPFPFPLFSFLSLYPYSKSRWWSWAIRLKAYSIRFDSIHYCCVTRGWGPLWTVVYVVECTRKMMSLGLAINAQWRKYESKKTFH